MEASQRLAYLFRRYFTHECTPAEKNELFDLLLSSEHDASLRRLIDDTWKEDFPSYVQDKQTADAVLRHIVSHREPATPPSAAEDPIPALLQPRRRILTYTGWAASLLGITLLGFLVFYSHHSAPPQPAPPPVLAARPTINRCITLSDGTTVLLNRNARLDYQKGFNEKTREVTLHGEAYFAIHHDSRPFIVHTGAIRTTVLATAFNISAPNEHDIVITVTKGKVKVENSEGEYSILRRNEQLRLDSLHTRLKKISVDAGEVLAWKKPYMIFNDVTMKEAMDEIASRFRAVIVFTNPAAENCPVTASFTESESLEAIVKVLTKINNLEYAVEQGRILISGEGCK